MKEMELMLKMTHAMQVEDSPWTINRELYMAKNPKLWLT